MKAVHQSKAGFTLVEIMIVVVIIGLLVTMAIPTFRQVRERAQNTRFMNDIRVAVGAFNTYAIEVGTFPSDVGPATIPAGMEEDLRPLGWTESTSVGGNWDWDYDVFGIEAAVSVNNPIAKASQMLDIDDRLDDGDFTSGVFQRRPGGYMYIIEYGD